MANKYGKYGVPVPWDAIKTLWCTGEKPVVEIGRMFNVIPNTIATRARREGWHQVREKVFRELSNRKTKAPDPIAPEALHRGKDTDSQIDPSNVMISSKFGNPGFEKPPLAEKELIRKAVELSSATRFKERVIAANDKALIVLEKTEVCNVAEVDRFAEALTKVERIGARAFGYDREVEVPAINIGILTSGSEYTND